MQAVIISMHLGILKAGILWHLLWDPGLFAAHFYDTASAALGMIIGFACVLAVDNPLADCPAAEDSRLGGSIYHMPMTSIMRMIEF